MDQQEYKTLVNALEVAATVNPGAFRGKVIAISSAAYVALFTLLAAMALFIYYGITYAYTHRHTGNLIRIGLFALVMLPAFFVVLRMFFMRLPPPEGRTLSRQEAPKLFGALDKMRKQLNGPPIHHVLIDDEFNASIFQRPRWGLFGGHTNYLMLGLPYLLSMSPKEMLATVAHEYGHVCGNHGKVSAWIYRQRRTFGALYEQVNDSSEDNWVHGAMARMLHKFMPYYNAHTFVLARQNEYDADLTATELVGARANASGLIRGELLGCWLHQEFWPKLYQQANSHARPVFLPFSAMRTAFKASYDQWATKDNLSRAWSRTSDLLDTHPALRERVEATGEEPAIPKPVELSAADALLGEHVKTMIDAFDQRWWEKEKKEWTARHQHVTRSKARLQELRKLPLNDLKLHDLQELAMASAEFEPIDTAKAILEHLMRQPGGPFARAELEYGRILLTENNERGLDHLATAARSDRHLRDHAARLGYAYLLKKHGEVEAQQWWHRLMPEEETA